MFWCLLHHLQADHCVTCSKSVRWLQCCYTMYNISHRTVHEILLLNSELSATTDHNEDPGLNEEIAHRTYKILSENLNWQSVRNLWNYLLQISDIDRRLANSVLKIAISKTIEATHCCKVTRVRNRKEKGKFKKRKGITKCQKVGQESRYERILSPLHSIGLFFPLATIKNWTEIKNQRTDLWHSDKATTNPKVVS